MTGEEILASGQYSVLEVDEDKAVGAQLKPFKGLTYVVRRKGHEGLNLAVLVPIDPKRLKRHQPRLPHPSMCTDEKSRTPDIESRQAEECNL
jgi:hypothetical protein